MIALLWALYARALDRAGSLLDTLALLWSLIAEPEAYYCEAVVEAEPLDLPELQAALARVLDALKQAEAGAWGGAVVG